MSAEFVWRATDSTIHEIVRELYRNRRQRQLAHLDVSAVTNMRWLFVDRSLAGVELSSWDVSAVRDMANMFRNATFVGAVGLANWNVSQVVNMYGMFYKASVNEPISAWDTHNVHNMCRMFCVARAFNQPLNNWDTTNVTDTSYMFSGAVAFNQPIGAWNVSRVTSMNSMFCYARAFNQPLGAWNTAAVTDMDQMFQYADAFVQPIYAWSIPAVQTLTDLVGRNYQSISEHRFAAVHLQTPHRISWRSANSQVQRWLQLYNRPLDVRTYETMRAWLAAPHSSPLARVLVNIPYLLHEMLFYDPLEYGAFSGGTALVDARLRVAGVAGGAAPCAGLQGAQPHAVSRTAGGYRSCFE